MMYDAVSAYLRVVGYSDADIAAGMSFAADASTEDEALSLATSAILYSEAQLANGARFPVEPGSVNWSAPDTW